MASHSSLKQQLKDILQNSKREKKSLSGLRILTSPLLLSSRLCVVLTSWFSSSSLCNPLYKCKEVPNKYLLGRTCQVLGARRGSGKGVDSHKACGGSLDPLVVVCWEWIKGHMETTSLADEKPTSLLRIIYTQAFNEFTLIKNPNRHEVGHFLQIPP